MKTIWIGSFYTGSIQSLFYAIIQELFALSQAEHKIIRMAARKSQVQAVTMSEKQTPLLTESLVRDGRTHSLMITVLLMWEITTSVGILLGLPNPRCGALPLILNISTRIVRFLSARLWRLLTFLWTITMNLTRTTDTRKPLFKKKISHNLSQSALLLWYRHGPSLQMRSFSFYSMTMETSGTGLISELLKHAQNFRFDLKIHKRF